MSKDLLQITPLTWSAADGMEAGTNGFLGVKTNPMRKAVVLGGRSEPVMGPAGWAEKKVVDGKVVRVGDSKWLLGGKLGDGHGGNMHPIDDKFSYFNIDENVGRRLRAWGGRQ